MNDSAELLEKVYQAYEQIGFPREIINQWSIAHTDISDLVHIVRTQAPENVLEVGTFVGVSTMLIALSAEGCKITTIDPNPEIGDLLSSMGSALGDVDRAARVQDIGARAAALLGVADRIEFVEGGFATPESFASRLGREAERTEVVGPDVCARKGPFDLVFADGLHFEDDVYADANVATQALAENGILLFHDCIGVWGRNVRAGLYRFLSENETWRLRTFPYADLYRSLGMVFRAASPPRPITELDRPAAGPDAHQKQKIAHNVRLVCDIFEAAAVVELVLPKPPFTLLTDDAEGSVTSTEELDPSRSDELAAVLRAADFVVSGHLDRFSQQQMDLFLSLLRDHQRPALVFRSPPGEVGAADNDALPLENLVGLAGEKGLSLYELPQIEFSTRSFLFGRHDHGGKIDSMLSSALLISSPDIVNRAYRNRTLTVDAMSVAQARVHDQRILENIHYANGFRRIFAEAANFAPEWESTFRSNIQLKEELKAAQVRVAHLEQALYYRILRFAYLTLVRILRFAYLTLVRSSNRFFFAGRWIVSAAWQRLLQTQTLRRWVERKRAKKLSDAFDDVVKGNIASYEPVKGRVLHYCGSLSPGGAEKQLANMASAQAAMEGYDVHVLLHSLQNSNGLADFHLERLKESGASVREIRQRHKSIEDIQADIGLVPLHNSAIPAHVLVDITNMIYEILEIKPEIVHCWLDWDNVRGGVAAVVTGAPKIVLSGRNLAPYNFKLHTPDMLPAYKALITKPNVKLVNNSGAGARDYADWIGINPTAISVIHNGYEFLDDPKTDCRAEWLRRSLHIAEDDLLVGGVFRFEEEKQPLLWIEVATRIAKILPNVRFSLWGQGSYRERMQQAIDRAGLSERFTLNGVTKDPLAAMAAMDVFLLTSYGEGLPNVLIEAQSVGTPVVTTAAGGAPETLVQDETGKVVEGTDPDQLAAAVLELLEDQQRRKQMSQKGPAHVAATFSLQRSLDRTLEVYRNIRNG